jgi:hypothetical protein
LTGGCAVTTLAVPVYGVVRAKEAAEMSEQPNHRTSTPEDEASEAGATSEGFGNLSVEDDAEGTVNPAELAGTAGPGDDAVDG